MKNKKYAVMVNDVMCPDSPSDKYEWAYSYLGDAQREASPAANVRVVAVFIEEIVMAERCGPSK